MAKEDKKTEQSEEEEEVKEVRHTISAEETFTLAKDVFDLRCYFRNLYKNRAVIARRLNIFSLICSLIFTMLYAGYNIWNVSKGVLSFGQEVAVYILIGVYLALIISFVIVVCCSNNANTKSLKKYNKALKIFRIFLRLVSIAMAIAGIVVSSANGENALRLSFRIVLIVVSVISIIIQSIPLFFGGFIKFVRWTTSPARRKTRFTKVLLEWYGLIQSGNSDKASVKRVSRQYIDQIGEVIDGYLLPRFGKRKITDIDANAIYSAADEYPEDKAIIEGIFKNVFSYAKECGYINTDPTKEMKMEGSIEVQEKKPKKTIKGGIANLGKKIGKSIFNKFLGSEDK